MKKLVFATDSQTHPQEKGTLTAADDSPRTKPKLKNSIISFSPEKVITSKFTNPRNSYNKKSQFFIDDRMREWFHDTKTIRKKQDQRILLW